MIFVEEIISDSFEDTLISGQIGMGYSNQPNFLDLAYEKGEIKSPDFIINYLCCSRSK